MIKGDAMTRGSKEKEIKRLLRAYYRATDGGLYPLCEFIGEEKPRMLKKFKKYLVSEGILKDAGESIFFKYASDCDETYSIRALVLEDFLRKHL